MRPVLRFQQGEKPPCGPADIVEGQLDTARQREPGSFALRTGKTIDVLIRRVFQLEREQIEIIAASRAAKDRLHLFAAIENGACRAGGDAGRGEVALRPAHFTGGRPEVAQRQRIELVPADRWTGEAVMARRRAEHAVEQSERFGMKFVPCLRHRCSPLPQESPPWPPPGFRRRSPGGWGRFPAWRDRPSGNCRPSFRSTAAL